VNKILKRNTENGIVAHRSFSNLFSEGDLNSFIAAVMAKMSERNSE